MTSLFKLIGTVTYNYSAAPTITTTSNSSVSFATLAPLLLMGFIASLFLLIIPMWKIFKKAGRPGWTSIIPIYSTWVLFEIVGYTAWVSILLLVPIVSIIPGIMSLAANFRLAKLFGKNGWFGVLLIVFPWIGLPILGYGKAPFQGGDSPTSTNGPATGTPAVAPTTAAPVFQAPPEAQAPAASDPVQTPPATVEPLAAPQPIAQTPPVEDTQNSDKPTVG